MGFERRAPRLPVLLYHHVGSRAGNPRPLTVTTSRFRSQMDWLADNGYVGVGVEQWRDALAGRSKITDRPVLLTFDDGYRDLCDDALPILAGHGFGALVFVVTEGRTNRWDELAGATSRELMRPDEIREWSRRGFDFGAHSRTHIDLRELPDARMENEIYGSADDLEGIVGRPVVSFAYPFGFHDSRVVSCARRRFLMAFTVEEGLNSHRTDPLRLRRTMVQDHDTLIDFIPRLRLGWSPRAHLRTRLALCRRRILGLAKER